MNSGYRWPYGRREGVLPVWAHRRVLRFPVRLSLSPRVIFQNRTSEGFASRTSNDSTPDSDFCLSFNVETTKRSALDAISCASAFSSDKGRFLVDADIANGYAEPAEETGAGAGSDRPLDRKSVRTRPVATSHPARSLAARTIPTYGVVQRRGPAGHAGYRHRHHGHARGERAPDDLRLPYRQRGPTATSVASVEINHRRRLQRRVQRDGVSHAHQAGRASGTRGRSPMAIPFGANRRLCSACQSSSGRRRPCRR